MKATVYFTHLTDEDRDTINGGGWDTDIGKRYHAAKAGEFTSATRRFFELAALIAYGATRQMDATRAAEKRMIASCDAIYSEMQNRNVGWPDKPSIECKTDFPRSMDVGDVIVFEQGPGYAPGPSPVAYRCCDIGWSKVNYF